MSIIHLDNRERALIAHFEAINVKAQIESLELGDIQIRSGDILFVFERKTMADLAASIKDGRYREQKARLLSNVLPHHITYLIEDATTVRQSHSGHGITDAVYRGMFLNTMYRDGIHVVFTSSVADTAQWVIDLAQRIEKDGGKWMNGSAINGINGSSYIDCLKAKRRKIENIDTMVCFQLQLCQIPGISTTIAKSLSERFKNMREFLNALQASADESRLSLLTSTPSVGAKKAETILRYLGYM